MSSVIINENLVGMGEAARFVPSSRPGRTIDPATMIRWITMGAKLRDGGRLKLRATRSPGGWLTSRIWIEEFLAALTADRNGSVAPLPGAEERAAQATARLQARGFSAKSKRKAR
jgi:hypothetical protein